MMTKQLTQGGSETDDSNVVVLGYTHPISFRGGKTRQGSQTLGGSCSSDSFGAVSP